MSLWDQGGLAASSELQALPLVSLLSLAKAVEPKLLFLTHLPNLANAVYACEQGGTGRVFLLMARELLVVFFTRKMIVV